MIQISTYNWSVELWNTIILWCAERFGPDSVANGWTWQDDYSMWITEENLIILKLAWGI